MLTSFPPFPSGSSLQRRLPCWCPAPRCCSQHQAYCHPAPRCLCTTRSNCSSNSSSSNSSRHKWLWHRWVSSSDIMSPMKSACTGIKICFFIHLNYISHHSSTFTLLSTILTIVKLLNFCRVNYYEPPNFMWPLFGYSLMGKLAECKRRWAQRKHCSYGQCDRSYIYSLLKYRCKITIEIEQQSGVS